MKKCDVCGAEFAGQFNFCPVDGQTLSKRSAAESLEYFPTIISDDSLIQRVAVQVSFLIERVRAGWPQFKSNPPAFFKNQTRQACQTLQNGFARPYRRTGLAAAVVIIMLAIAAITIVDREMTRHRRLEPDDDLTGAVLLDSQTLPSAESKSESGNGANANGRVGFNKGRGEGSGPTPARAQGGGGGGEHSPVPTSVGRLPQPSEIPAPIPTTYARALPQTLPDAGIKLDPVLWKDLPYPNYGDPQAKSTAPSNGPGEGGGVGTGKGDGVGSGEKNGVGPGRNGNTGTGDNATGCCGPGGSHPGNGADDIDRIFTSPEVTTRARVISKPEPQYTEEARKAGTTGTVILSVVFSRTGQVVNIRAVQTLCCGLTEKAIAAARQIRFIPAMRKGQVVSTYMQLQYNFNLY
jgi:TonB family protein